jgi:hypothetical protein
VCREEMATAQALIEREAKASSFISNRKAKETGISL